MTPAKMRSVAWPRSLGPSTDSATLTMPKAQHGDDERALRAQHAQQPLAGAPKSSDFSAAAGHHQPARADAGPAGPACGGAAGAGAGRRRSATWSMPSRRRAHAGGLLLGELGQDDLAVGLVARPSARRGCRCRRPRPSSSTTMRSASRMVLTRWATMTTVASAVSRGQRRPQRGVGGVVQRRERVVEQVDLGPARPGPGRWPGAAAGRRRRWCRPGRSARPGPSGIASTKSRAWATSSACHSSSSVASGLP